MIHKLSLRWFLLLALFAGFLNPTVKVSAATNGNVTAFDLIVAMNTLRTSYGLPALVEDPIIDAVAQGTAQTMAAAEMSWHIGNVSGRVQAAGYGGGAKVWATENFASGYFASIDQIMQVWTDPAHMLPAVTKAYCNIGAGEAKAPNGMMYYVLQAAYTDNKSCGDYVSVGGATTSKSGSTTTGDRAGGVSQLIVPVKIAAPDANGKIYHIVQAGQSFWSIAIAYKITIADIEKWNNISKDAKLQVGEKLFIPSANTAGYFTPTPVGMIQVSTPGSDGKIIHVVQAYQTLSTISDAYGTKVDTILLLNAWQVDWPLQIGQKLVINRGNITPSPTPRPLTPIEKLTPAADGKYYHTVKSGETLSWIANLYQVSVSNLMAWNDLSDASILQPNEKLLLNVTPPATQTPVPKPATITPTATLVPPSSTPALSPTPSLETALTATPLDPPPAASKPSIFWLVILGLAAGSLGLIVFFMRKRS